MGEHAWLLDCADIDSVHALLAFARRERPAGVVEVVAGWRSVLVTAEPGDVDAVEAWARSLPGRTLPAPGGSAAGVVEVPVTYDGPDLADVATITGLTVDEVVARHLAPTYTVAVMGFSPGFGYLAGLDPALHVPRLATPRPAVPAGSVAIAGPHAGVYPQPTPGGWRILGRTEIALFDVSARPPALLAPGRRVRFTSP